MARKVVHLTFSDSGGAGKVAHQLAAAQSEIGWESDVISLISTDLRSQPLSFPVHTLSAAIDNFLVKKNDFPSLISLGRDSVKTKALEKVHSADIIHLQWLNGVASLESVTRAFPETPIVWTLHDMNPFTGVCHQALGCKGFQKSCSQCPAVKRFAWTPVENNLKRKMAHANSTDSLSLVAPSPWLATLATSSAVFRDMPVEVIPNPVDESFLSREQSKTNIGTKNSSDAFKFVVIASNLSDPLKSVETAVRALTALRINFPGAKLHLVGRGGQHFAHHSGVTLRGTLTSSQIAELLSEVVAVLVPSVAENAPLVIAESGVLGVPCITSQAEALPAMIHMLGAGHSAHTQDEWVSAMATAIEKFTAHDAHKARGALALRSRMLFDPVTIAEKYISLYEKHL